MDRLAREEPEPGIVELRVDHPDEVSGTTYSIELRNDDDDDCYDSEDAPLLEGADACVVLSATGAQTTVYVPLAIGDDPDDPEIDSGTSVQGGSMTIDYDGDEISLTSGHE